MIRRTLAATFAVGLLAVLPGTPAQADYCRMGFTCFIDYYSDASKTNRVGGTIIDCDGTVFSEWGVTTPFRTRSDLRCPDEN